MSGLLCFLPFGCFLFHLFIPGFFFFLQTYTFVATESAPTRRCCYWWVVCLLDLIVSPAIWSSTMTMKKRHGRSSRVSSRVIPFFLPFFLSFFFKPEASCVSSFYDDRKLFLWMTLTQVNFRINEGKEFPKSFR